jgi:hypothetical protein
MKEDGHLGRNFLAGATGDTINVVLTAKEQIAQASCRRLRRKAATSFRSFRLLACTAAERWPCFSGAARHRSRPSAVRAPVDCPPCIRHRPLAIPGLQHADPDRVRAPQRGASDRSPGGLPFLSHPIRSAWGTLLILHSPPYPSACAGHDSSSGQLPPPDRHR